MSILFSIPERPLLSEEKLQKVRLITRINQSWYGIRERCIDTQEFDELYDRDVKYLAWLDSQLSVALCRRNDAIMESMIKHAEDDGC